MTFAILAAATYAVLAVVVCSANSPPPSAELRRMLEEPEPEAKSLGQVACEGRWGDSVWLELDDEMRARWERAAAAVIAEHERRNPRKVPTLDEVADVVREKCGYDRPWKNVPETTRDFYRAIARAVFPLFGCEP